MKTQNFQLIDGTYTPSQSRDLISALLKSNINFFKLQSLSMQESGKSDLSHPTEQIEYLMYIEASLHKLIQAASAHGLKFQISGFIEISAVPAEAEISYSNLPAYV